MKYELNYDRSSTNDLRFFNLPIDFPIEKDSYSVNLLNLLIPNVKKKKKKNILKTFIYWVNLELKYYRSRLSEMRFFKAPIPILKELEAFSKIFWLLKNQKIHIINFKKIEKIDWFIFRVKIP
jgi:hypothetical protein